MALCRCWGLIALSVVLANLQNARSQGQFTCTLVLQDIAPGDKKDLTCTVYALDSLARDPGFAKWVADTIPEVIEPGSWGRAGRPAGTKERPRLVYNAPAKILVVYQTPAAHTKIAAFLQDLKKAVPHTQGRAVVGATASAAGGQAVVPAGYAAPALIRSSEAPASPKSTYPVPAPAQQPKHLFHLIIRYEGEGIVDSNVAELFKSLYGQGEGKAEAAPKEGPAQKPASLSPTTPQLSQLFNFIVRYEGEGIIDSNVADLVSSLYSQSGRWQMPAAAPACAPACTATPYAVPLSGGLGGAVGQVAPASPSVGTSATASSYAQPLQSSTAPVMPRADGYPFPSVPAPH
jgi:hypothetical protein